MNPREANAVLALAGQFDGRKPDAETAISWAELLNGLRVEDCIAAVKAHYIESTRWVMPADIRRRVNAIRQDRIDRGRASLVPPRWLDDIEDDGKHAIAYLGWIRGAEEALANGEIPDVGGSDLREMPPEVRAALPPEITKLMDDNAAKRRDREADGEQEAS